MSNDTHMPWRRVPNKPFRSDSLDEKAKEEYFKTDFMGSWESYIIVALAFIMFMVLLLLVA